MIIKLLSILILSVLIFFSGMAEAVRLKEEKEIKINPEAVVHGASTGNIVIESPDSVIFLDRFYNPDFVIPAKGDSIPVISGGGIFYAIMSEYRFGEDSVSRIATIYNNQREPLYSFYDIPAGEHYLSPSGNYLITIGGNIMAYEGKLYFQHRELPLIIDDIEFYEGLLIADEGRHFFIDSGNRGLRLYNSEGKLIRAFEAQSDFTFGRDSEKYVVFRRGIVQIFDQTDKVIEIDVQKNIVDQILLREDLNMLVISFHDEIAAYDIETGEELWRKYARKEGANFPTLDIAPNGKFLACGVDINRGNMVEQWERHIEGFLYLFNIKGRKEAQVRFTYESYVSGLPRVWHLPDNRTILVRNNASLHFITMF